MEELLSNCCNAEILIEEDTTSYYICTECGYGCDPK